MTSNENASPPSGATVDQSPIQPLAPAPADAHKSDRGKVLIVAGSRGMVGAAALAAEAALRGGAGLVSISCPQSVYPILAAMVPCATTVPLPETASGGLGFEALGTIMTQAEGWATAVVIGPGLGRAPQTVQLVQELIKQLKTPFIADADALFAVAGDLANLERAEARGILTPHEGEMAKLGHCTASDVKADRMESARKFVARSKHVLVLKGHGTLVADHQRTWRCERGNPGMATGGTGDVLAGLLGALLAQEGDAYRAARVGVEIHARAGDLAARRLGERSMLASDLLAALPSAFLELSSAAPPSAAT